MMDNSPMTTYADGAPIQPDEAWRILDRWRTAKSDVGLIFWGRSGNVYTKAAIRSARNGRLELAGGGCRALFNLAGATFRYGPMQFWPRWPTPQTVELIALRAQFDNGDYLALAQDLPPRSLPVGRTLLN